MKTQDVRLVGLAALVLLSATIIGGCRPEERTVETIPPTTEDQSVTQSGSPEAVQPTATQPSSFVSPLNSPIATPRPTPTFPSPAKDKAAVRGGLMSLATQRPIAETNVYLTLGVGEQGDQPPHVLAGPQENDIRGFTDERGWFAIDDVPPGTYILIIWAPLHWVVLSTGEGDMATPTSLVLEAGQVLDLGEMRIWWP